MKIMIIASWYPEGNQITGSFFRDRAQHLAACGCEVNVAFASLRVCSNNKSKGLTIQKNGGITEYRYFKRNLTPFSERGIAWQKVRMIQEIYMNICKDSGRPDIIHLESARCAKAAVALAQREQIPLTYTEHYSKILNSIAGSYYNRLMRFAVNNSDYIFLISSVMKRKLNPPAEKWAMLPNETDFSIFTPTTPPKHFTFKALGSFSKIKGYDQLISAFAEVHKRYPNCRLVIGGYGKEEMRLKKLCKQLALTDCVTFPGKILLENRNAFYQNTSAFVCSSHTETFSVVIIEAFACGIPVIATECGGPEDLITSKNGYLVKRDNIASLTQGMIKMIENRQHFNGEEIRAQAAALYDIDIIIKKQIDCFNTAISRFPNKKEEK